MKNVSLCYMPTAGFNVLTASAAGAWSIAAALMCMIYAVGNVSGGHFNPAVTLSVFLGGRDKISASDAIKYAGDLSCWICGAAVVICGATECDAPTTPGKTIIQKPHQMWFLNYRFSGSSWCITFSRSLCSKHVVQGSVLVRIERLSKFIVVRRWCCSCPEGLGPPQPPILVEVDIMITNFIMMARFHLTFCRCPDCQHKPEL